MLLTVILQAVDMIITVITSLVRTQQYLTTMTKPYVL